MNLHLERPLLRELLGEGFKTATRGRSGLPIAWFLNPQRHVLGVTIPYFESKTLTECWQDGKSYIVNRYIKYKCLKLAETVEKVGSIGIGREISQLCHISCSDAMTRGSQIRKGFTCRYKIHGMSQFDWSDKVTLNFKPHWRHLDKVPRGRYFKWFIRNLIF